VIALMNFTKVLFIDCDASSSGLGVVSMQDPCLSCIHNPLEANVIFISLYWADSPKIRSEAQQDQVLSCIEDELQSNSNS